MSAHTFRQGASLACALLLAACGGGGGAAPAPAPSSTPAGPTGVAYVPYADGIYPVTQSTLSIGAPIPLPSGASAQGAIALDAAGATLYALASSNSGLTLVADALAPNAATLRDAVSISSPAGPVQIVTRANGDVVVLTVPAASSQSATIYDAALALTAGPTSIAPYASTIATPQSGNLYGIDAQHYVDAIGVPSFAVIASSRATGFVTPTPLVADAASGILYTTNYDPASSSTTLYAIDPSALSANAVVRVPGNGSAYGASHGLVLLGVNPTAPRLFAIDTISSGVTPIDLSGSGETLAGAALSADGTTIIAALNANASSTLVALDATTGKTVASLVRTQRVIGAIVTH